MSLEFNIFLSIAVLFGNAFFVGAEFALISARRSSMELMALDGSRAAKITLQAMERVSLMLAGAQLGITLCSLIFGAVSEPLVAHALEVPFHAMGMPEHLLHPISFLIALILMSYLHVVIGEMVPKNLALAVSTKAALILVPPLFYLVKITSPLITSLNAIANGFIRLMGVKPQAEVRSSFNHDEVAGFIKESRREGLLSKGEERLLSGALDLEDRTIEHIVLPMDKTVNTSIAPTPAEIEKLCATTGFSRFPVPNAEGGLEGYIHLKDLLQLTNNDPHHKLPRRYIRPLGRVKAETSLRDTLALMQRTGAHISEVFDEKRRTIGIVMLEDVLEELVGPIRDETRKA